jgi:hypothetical protein
LLASPATPLPAAQLTTTHQPRHPPPQPTPPPPPLQIKTDEDGYNIGIIFDNRTRPHQYEKFGGVSHANAENTSRGSA